MAKGLKFWVVVAVLLATPALAHAASPWTDEIGYGNRAGGKFVFGLKNVLLGWTEIFTQPGDSINEGDNFFVGVGKGLVNAVGQEIGGALHLITFPITGIDIPLPEGGTNLP
jgi:hypothetical protein